MRDRREMMALARRHSDQVVFEPQLRKNLIAEGLVAEYKDGESCASPGCYLCTVMVCPSCGRRDRRGEVVFLVDYEPFVLMADQAVKPHAAQPMRNI